MRIFPILPIWLVLPISLLLIIFILFKRQRLSLAIKYLVLVVLIFLINLRFMFPNGREPIVTTNLDVLFVVDNTISMQAEDYNGSNKRMVGVRKDIEYIMDELDGSRFAVITFDNQARINVPYTFDKSMALESILILKPIDEMYAKGTNLDLPIEVMNTLFVNTKKNNDNVRIVFFVSDGEITSVSKRKSFSGLKKYIDNGAVLGYGTTNGGYMHEYDEYTEKEEYVKDENYNNAISRLDENNLKMISKELGIDYIKMNNKNDIDNKLSKIKKIAKETLVGNDKSTYNDIYFIFLIPLLIDFILIYREYER